jgi:hypothetical protein
MLINNGMIRGDLKMQNLIESMVKDLLQRGFPEIEMQTAIKNYFGKTEHNGKMVFNAFEGDKAWRVAEQVLRTGKSKTAQAGVE